MLRIMMLLAKARNDVMFAHYAVRRNIIHAVNITAEGNYGLLLREKGDRLRWMRSACGYSQRSVYRIGNARFSRLVRTPHPSLGHLIRQPSAATCLAAARAQNGSCIINAIHYRSAASLPTGEGNTRIAELLHRPKRR